MSRTCKGGSVASTHRRKNMDFMFPPEPKNGLPHREVHQIIPHLVTRGCNQIENSFSGYKDRIRNIDDTQKCVKMQDSSIMYSLLLANSFSFN